MSDGTYDIVIKRGTTFTLGLTLKKANGVPMDLTGMTARSQVRKTYTDPQIAATFTITFASNRKTGKLTLTLEEIDTRVISITSGVYDLELVDSAIVTRILEGKVQVTPEVTK